MLKPLGERLLVKTKAAVAETASGLIIPTDKQVKDSEGEVVATGELVKTVKVGDRVLFGKYSGTEIKVEGEEYLVMNESDVYGIL
jgi:chaperonin GroES